MRDPYSVLGVQKDAGADEIKAAWRNKAKSIHPDQNRDDPLASVRFTEIGQAYDLLKDPAKRSRYDQALRMAEVKKREQTILQQREASRQAAERAKVAQANAERIMEELARAEAQKPKPAATTTAGAPNLSADGIGTETGEEMINRIFGTPGQPQSQAQAQAQAQAAAVKAQAKSQPAASEDDTAPDPKSEDASGHPKPPVLQAIDLLASVVRRFRGTQPAAEKAPDLIAESTITIEDLIKENWITVHLSDGRDVRFVLEAGMSDGFVVRLKGQGLKIPGLARGDLNVTLRVARSHQFSVEGFDIHTILPVALEDAVLGRRTTVETPSGPAEITIPAWSGSDQMIRLDGQGLPDGTGGRGALVVELRLMLWEKPDDKVTDLMRHMREGLFL
jgi:DnaJ-class molecular chaperone